MPWFDKLTTGLESLPPRHPRPELVEGRAAPASPWLDKLNQLTSEADRAAPATLVLSLSKDARHPHRSPGSKLSRHLRHDRVDMGGGAIDGGETGIRLAEDQVEVRAGQHDRLGAVTAAQRMRQLPQLRFIVG